MAQLLTESLLDTHRPRWEFIASSTAGNTTSVTTPTGAQVGDLVIIVATSKFSSANPVLAPVYNGSGSLTTLDNLVYVQNTAGGSANTLIAYSYPLQTADITAFSFNNSGPGSGGNVNGRIALLYRPYDAPTFVLDVIPTSNTNFVTETPNQRIAVNTSVANTVSVPAITTVVSNNIIIRVGAVAINSTPTAPTGHTNFVYTTMSDLSLSGAANGGTIMVATKQQTASGAEAAATFGNIIGAATANIGGAGATLCLRTQPIAEVQPFGDHETTYVYAQNTVITKQTANLTVYSEKTATYTVSISGGTNSQFSVDGGAFTTGPASVSIGATGVNIAVSQTNTNTAVGTNTTSTATLTVGTQTGNQSLITVRNYLVTGGNIAEVNSSFTYTANVTTVNVYAVGGGGGSSADGGGSGATFVNAQIASINSTATVTVGAGGGGTTSGGNGGNSYVRIATTNTVIARGGIGSTTINGAVAVTTGSSGNTINKGGDGGNGSLAGEGGGGGGAGGYTGGTSGGDGGLGGGTLSTAQGTAGAAGTGASGGGGASRDAAGAIYLGGGGGGGTGVYGSGTVGTAGARGTASAGGGGGGSGSAANNSTAGVNGGTTGGNGGTGGGGAGGSGGNRGGAGAVRLFW